MEAVWLCGECIDPTGEDLGRGGGAVVGSGWDRCSFRHLPGEGEGSVETSQGEEKWRVMIQLSLPSPLPWICPRAAVLRPHHHSSDGVSPPPPFLVVLHTLSSFLSLRIAPLAFPLSIDPMLKH